MATCDRCSAEVASGEGHAVYSEAHLGPGMEVGAMLLCNNCANEVFTDKVWSKAKHLAREFDPSSIEAMRPALRQANDFSVALRAKRRGLTAVQARHEAREIAELWWKDEEAAGQRLVAQSSEPTVGTELQAEKGKWWEFWKSQYD